jgi:hypothetical protein
VSLGLKVVMSMKILQLNKVILKVGMNIFCVKLFSSEMIQISHLSSRTFNMSDVILKVENVSKLF